MQYYWVKIFHFDDSYLHVFHNLMYVNKIIWLNLYEIVVKEKFQPV
jgi:hypothetical protein